MFKVSLFIVISSFVGFANAGHWYEPEQPGHGMTIQAVGSEYAAQWYFHDGDMTRWVASDVCRYGEPCPVFTVDANGFPAVGAELVEAGEITLVQDGEALLVEYALDVEEVVCGFLPGPFPAECRNDDGSLNPAKVLIPGLQAEGALELEPLVD